MKEQAAREALALQSSRHARAVKEHDMATLHRTTRMFTEEQNTIILDVLVEVFNDKKLRGDETLGSVLTKTYTDHMVTPILQQHPGMFNALHVGNLRYVIKMFLDKIAVCDWLTAHISDELQEEIDDATLEKVESAFRLSLKTKGARDMVDEITELLEQAEQLSQATKDGSGDLHEMLYERVMYLAYEDEELEVHAVHAFKGLRAKHIVAFIRYAKRKMRRLRTYINAKVYSEQGAELQELPCWIALADVEEEHTVDAATGIVSVPSDALGWDLECEEGDDKPALVHIAGVHHGGAADHAGVTEGMVLLRVCDTHVRSVDDVVKQLSKIKCKVPGVFEISVRAAGAELEEELEREETALLMDQSESFAGGLDKHGRQESAGGLQRQSSSMSTALLRGASSGMGLQQGASYDEDQEAALEAQRKDEDTHLLRAKVL